MKVYQQAVAEILQQGTRKENRTGVDTLSTFNINYEVDLQAGFPLLTTKAISWKNIVVENLWFLSGEPKIDFLTRHGCKFWDAWADTEGNVPSAYGNFWRHFPVHGKPIGEYSAPTFNDQIAWVVAELKRNPMSRRMVVSAWAPGNAQTSKLPPCHSLFVLNVQNTNVLGAHGTIVDIEKTLNLHLTQRSCDIALGVPYNIAGYAFLLELFSRFGGLKPGVFAHTLVDAHAYTKKPDGAMAEYDHIPGLIEQLSREPKPLPRLVIDPSITGLDDIPRLLSLGTEELMNLFRLEGYDPHPAIKFRVAV